MQEKWRLKMEPNEIEIGASRQKEQTHLSPTQHTACKEAINNVIWMYASPKMTLEQAEDIACEMWRKICESW